jgi:RNA polymerase sigma-32 factor
MIAELNKRTPRKSKPVKAEVLAADELEVEEELPAEEATEEKSLVPAGALQLYLSEIRKYPLLTREEELKIATRYFKKGDPNAAARLVTGNLRLVVKIAMEYRRAFIQVLDLIQEGNIGLMQAVKKFNPYKGVKLSSYAAWWIKAYILRYILNNWRMVKIGTTQAQRKLFFNLQKEKERLESLGIVATPALIGKGLDVAEETVNEMEQRLARPDLSIDAPVGDSNKSTVGDLLPGQEIRQDTALANAEELMKFRAALTDFELDLTEKETFILQHRLLADDPMTLQEIGDQLGVTRERIRQLESRLLEKMRAFMIERGLGPLNI